MAAWQVPTWGCLERVVAGAAALWVTWAGQV